MKRKIIFLALLSVFIITSGFGCKNSNTAAVQSSKPITLEYWRVSDSDDALDDVIAKYTAAHPYITINYRKLRPEEYETELLNALAEDRGPDILSIKNTWVKKYETKLAPLPAVTPIVYLETQGTIKKTQVPVVVDEKSLTLNDVKNNFVDTVYSDAVVDDQIYGLPLSLDTLALYYNRDLLNNAGIATIPTYWNSDFQQDVKKMSKQDAKGNILQSGVALGTSANINNFADILTLVMMQNGAKIIDDSGNVAMNATVSAGSDGSYSPAEAALQFYLDFANPVKEVYSWNNDMNNSLDAFVGGRLAFMFAYNEDLENIRARAPKLNFGVSPMLQIEGNNSVNMASYWLETVSKKSQHVNEAWNFVEFITKAENVPAYLNKAKRPTALRALIDSQKQDADLQVFANQILTARSWYTGYDVKSAEAAFASLLEDATKEGVKIADAMNVAANKIAQTLNP